MVPCENNPVPGLNTTFQLAKVHNFNRNKYKIMRGQNMKTTYFNYYDVHKVMK